MLTPDPAVRVRAVFADLSLALLAWEGPPLMGPREYRRLELVPDARPYSPEGKETLYGRAEYVDPYSVEADWEERA